MVTKNVWSPQKWLDQKDFRLQKDALDEKDILSFFGKMKKRIFLVKKVRAQRNNDLKNIVAPEYIHF